MITYEYLCGSCEHEYEFQQSIKDKPITTCPNCDNETLERVISGGNLIIMNNVTTVGSLMDKNTAKMGHYELQEKRYYDQKNKKDAKRKSQEAAIKKITGEDVKIPENVESFCDKDTIRKINAMTPEQQQKWVLEG